MTNISMLVLTGLSGAGKSVAANVMEDLGYYTIDNLPAVLLDKLAEVILDINTEEGKVALVIDSRSGDTAHAFEVIKKLKSKHAAEVIYFDSDEKTLIKRFKETRRPHPLGADLSDAISKEMIMLKDIKEISDLVIDTSSLTVHDLRRTLEQYFTLGQSSHIKVTVQSFGFKHGLPQDSDLVFDVRFLKNPHFVEALRDQNGCDKAVREYVFSDERAGKFLRKLKGMLSFLIPNYVQEGKRFLTVSIGCTGGKHRSVALSEFIYKYLNKKTELKAYLKHRDINR